MAENDDLVVVHKKKVRGGGVHRLGAYRYHTARRTRSACGIDSVLCRDDDTNSGLTHSATTVISSPCL
jgi:hypothetical protein